MNTKLQELTEKIYAEGVEKGKNEAAEIVAAAKAEAQRIKEAAEAEARKIVEQANAKAAETTKNTQSELKLYTEQSLNALKTEITNLICDKVASDSVKAATADPKFMQAIIVAITKVWVKEGAVEIEAKDAKALEDYFIANAKDVLEKGVKINEVKGMKTDFAIAPANGGYKITFGDNFLQKYTC